MILFAHKQPIRHDTSRRRKGECNTAARRIDTPFSFQRETAFSNSLDSCWLEPSDFNSFRFLRELNDRTDIALGKSNNTVWRGEIKDVPWKRTKGHCLVYSATARFSSPLSEIMLKLEISPFYIAGASARWLSLFSLRNLILPRAPRYLLAGYPSWIFIVTWPCFRFNEKTSNSRGRQNSNGIHETQTEIRESVIKFTEHKIGHPPVRSLIIDDGPMHTSRFIQNVRRASITRRCPRSISANSLK